MDKKAIKSYIIAKVQTQFNQDAEDIVNYILEKTPLSKEAEYFAIRTFVKERSKENIEQGYSNPKTAAMMDAAIEFDCSEKTVQRIIYHLF